MKGELAGQVKTVIAGRMKSALDKTMKAARTGRKRPGKLMSLPMGSESVRTSEQTVMVVPRESRLKRFGRGEGRLRLPGRRRQKAALAAADLQAGLTAVDTLPVKGVAEAAVAGQTAADSQSREQWEKDVALVSQALRSLAPATFRASTVGKPVTLTVPDDYTASVFREVLAESRKQRATDRLVSVQVSDNTAG